MLLPVSCVTGATCVSALFGINLLKVLLDAEYGGMRKISIGGRVLEIYRFHESPGLSVFTQDG